MREPAKLIVRLRHSVALVAALCGFHNPAFAASFTTQVFATGAAVRSTGADSITYGNNSLWVEYSNGASSTNYTGNSTVVQYNLSGSVEATYTVPGSADGLKYNPNTGQIWALQNQDANSQLTIIDPVAKTTTSFTYGAPYTSVSGSRGFDDVAFIGNTVYLSETNPSVASDPVIVKLNNSTPSSPITLSTVLTGNGILATDPDSIKSTPTGGLVLSGEGDGALTFVTNPGSTSPTATSLKLITASGAAAGSPDDSIYATAASGTFYLTDTGANTVYAISATGLTPNSLFVDVGNSFASVDPTTGIVTPIFTGTSPHGLEFVATPEPSAWAISLFGLALSSFVILRKRSRA